MKRVKMMCGMVLFGLLSFVIGAITVWSTDHRMENYIGHWRGDHDVQMDIMADHVFITRRFDSDNTSDTTQWQSTGEGIRIEKPPFAHYITDHYYRAKLHHNGNTLTLTSEHGDDLVFERVSR